jgi:DNA-binding winged helix-turn-helix (wHTH) protein
MKSLAEQPIYVFSEFRLDPSRRLLTRNGETLALHGKAFDLLLVLIENRDRLLLKDELLDSVWEGQFVEENNLAVQISVLRKIFHENGKSPRFIVTVPGKGYRFVADVQNGYTGNTAHPALANGSGGDQRYSPANGNLPDALKIPFEQNSLFTRPSVGSRKWAIIAVLVAAAGIVVYVAFRQGAFGTPLASDHNQPKIRQLTTKGRVALAAISPSGEFYVYTTDLVGERKRGLWIAQIKGGKNIELRPPDENLIGGRIFSRW